MDTFLLRLSYMIFYLVACHLVGDYVLRTDYISNTEGENWYHLFIHSFLYILPFAYWFGMDHRLTVLFVHHFIVDAANKRWRVIGYLRDQILHYEALVMLYVLPIFISYIRITYIVKGV